MRRLSLIASRPYSSSSCLHNRLLSGTVEPRSRRSMDRTQLCGSCNDGSIPSESTKRCSYLFDKSQKPGFSGLLCYTLVFFATAFARRDFLRDAVFFLMMPRLAALSIALYAALSDVFASSVPTFLAFFTAPVRVRLRRRLNTRFLSDERCAFFAEVVIAICSRILRHLASLSKPERTPGTIPIYDSAGEGHRS